MSYFFKRPIGGHGEVFCDALYADETLRIVQGHRRSIFVFSRVPSFDESDEEESGRINDHLNRRKSYHHPTYAMYNIDRSFAAVIYSISQIDSVCVEAYPIAQKK
jgi:hypothetical protein